MKILRNITGALFVVLAVVPVVFSALFLCQQHNIREQMEMALEEDELVTVLLSSKALLWHKKHKEILLNGHLFDVHSIIELEPGILEVKGLYDHQEQALHTRINDLLSGRSKSLPAFQGFTRWFSILYHDQLPCDTLPKPPVLNGLVVYLELRVQLTPAFTTIEFPPPRRIANDFAFTHRSWQD
ncbi:hypothetical protein EXU57_11240 [Segetibacter sp. 3557_3]|uniref:hypothetical protein n=1 Tax=Segetibacter sp. 3557_3 TaxID=2547429 RepID=UPI001058FC04|nr:hypothetical protein [Segetibacter sp. 3557_3]TDH26067.1 hypothetical protein EXU57_11240 [Segetibacter sp. 3557_3]